MYNNKILQTNYEERSPYGVFDIIIIIRFTVHIANLD